MNQRDGFNWRRALPHLLAVLSITLVSAFFMRDLAKPGLPMFHDSNPHIARMVNFHIALLDGQFPPMWAKELLGGIGSPVMMLNYQLPYFVSEGFVRLGLTYFDSYKLALALSLILSGILMYLALSSKFGILAAWVGALVYTLAPYRFVDIYVRGALGESLTFIFPPLLIWGFATSSLPLLVLGWAGLFLTHPLASAAFSGFFLGYTLFVGKKDDIAKRLKLFFTSFTIALLIAAFNLLPTLALTKYTYYSPALSSTLQMFPTLKQLFHSAWGYGVSIPGNGDGMSFELGIVQWAALILGLISIIWTKSNWTRLKEMRYLVVISAVCLFIMLPISIPIYQALHLTAIIDFPWRLLLCLIFASAWISAQLLDQTKIKPLKYLTAIVAVVALIATALPIAHTGKYWNRTPAWFALETGDSYGEYAPLTRSTRDSAPFWKRAESIKGTATVEQVRNRSNDQIYKVSSGEDTIIRVNTSYFIGWKAYIDGKYVPIYKWQDSDPYKSTCYITNRTQADIDDSGLIACHIGKGAHTLEIRYEATPVQRVGTMLTLAGIGIYLWILYRSFYPHTTNAKR